MNPQKDEPSETILIVDDNPANLRLLSQILGERGYHLRAVTSGHRALASVEATPPDLILLDIRMPGMDGYEVCQRLKANSITSEIPIIFISALDEIQDKVKAFSTGAVDYITKPFQLEEVVVRVETHLSLRRLQSSLREANRRMEKELELAAQVQASFMPKKLPEMPGWEIAVSLIPATQTSGDFYDILRLPDGYLVLLIADVVDKGVGAALFMAMSCALLRTYLMDHPANPEQVFAAVNQRILEYPAVNQFVTVFLGILDPVTGSLVYSNAGHVPPALVRPSQSGPGQQLEFTGPPLGVMEEATWEQVLLQVRPGDILVLCTDGINEAERGNLDFYGLERLVEITRVNQEKPAEAIRDAILADLHTFTDGRALGDDIALIVLEREQSGTE